MIKKLISTIILTVTSYAACISIDNPNHPCRYETGDSWCKTNKEDRPFAYNDDCLHKMNSDKIYGFTLSCGTGCALVYNYYGIKKKNDSIFEIALSVEEYQNEKRTFASNFTYFVECNDNGSNGLYRDENKTENMLLDIDIYTLDAYKKLTEFVCSE